MLECDYLVVGAGAAAMSFVDTIMTHSDRTVIIVDKKANPGGHWNHAYDFVKLHQAACFYGVPSEKLERDGQGATSKFKDLSSKKEILEYYRFVLDKLIKTGRVQHYGECAFQGKVEPKADNTYTFLDKNGVSHDVLVKTKLVDGTYTDVQVPSTTKRRYEVAKGVECVPINGIYKVKKKGNVDKKFVVIGAGKTGIDAVLYLLNNGIVPDNISWVMPRDSWLWNRGCIDPMKFLLVFFGPPLNGEDSTEEALKKMEETDYLMRVDKNVWPEKWSCATVEKNELVQLQSVKNIIRHGRVKEITKSHLVMTGKGESGPQIIPYEEGTIFVDCSALGLISQKETPIFQSGMIVLQPVLICMLSFSAAVLGYVECQPEFPDDDELNSLLLPTPYPNTMKDKVRVWLLTFHNVYSFFLTDPRIKNYFETVRLNPLNHHTNTTQFKVLAGGLYSLVNNTPRGIEGLLNQYKEKYDGQEFEHKVYDEEKLEGLRRTALFVTGGFYAALLGVSASLFYGLRSLKV
eukprot:CAMPEP_0116115250 /NCGR_PEP_ID=MMETSP0329-20121206/407_1 /TAXON_ID=697910 /ORGANISM="Pseudo-nitzschia arenysensis, Strain B593" /LENGTH=517 /DNA_ID=CAMNT_0003608671 /DNA_START=57 /DNA_END=1610 /DNA_ORIENTATION=-